jgi:hypothetical protein
LLFLSLPLFALLLKLLYVRRKQFYYVDHGIFAVHLYIFSFLVLLIYILLKKIETLSGWHWMTWPEIFVLLFSPWYYYRAMRIFYGQGRVKTLLNSMSLQMLSSPKTGRGSKKNWGTFSCTFFSMRALAWSRKNSRWRKY